MQRDLNRWKSRLSKRLLSISDSKQRAILFAERIATIDPASAVLLLKSAVIDNFALRHVSSRILVEAAMIALLKQHWPDNHRSQTLVEAVKQRERLASIFLGYTRQEQADNRENFAVPDYGTSRPLTLGERRSLASKPSRKMISMAVRDPHPMVIAKLLDNPKITENDVLFICSKRPTPFSTLLEVAIHPRFRVRKRVARALVNNPYTPVPAALTLLTCLDTPDLEAVVTDFTQDELIRETASLILKLAHLSIATKVPTEIGFLKLRT